MSHSVYSKKREEPGASERVLKFWSINGILLVLDIFESLLYKFVFKSEYIYWVYLLCKSGFFAFLFINNFHNASALYDSIIPNALAAVQPRVEYAVKKVSDTSDYVAQKVTPEFANSLAGQMSSIMMFIGSKLVSMLEFKAASTEPQRQLTNQPQANRMAMSMVSSTKEDILGNVKTDVNATQIGGRNIAATSRPKFDSGVSAI